jgi:chromosome segregation ATPase
MDDVKALEKRILTALARVAKGIEGRPAAASGDDAASGLRSELADAQAEIGRLRDRVRQAPQRDPSVNEARVDKLTRQLDVQGIEMQRLRKTNLALREQLRSLREAAEGGVDAAALNRAMKDELEALRATRHAEIAEMDEILGELTAMIGEVRHA